MANGARPRQGAHPLENLAGLGPKSAAWLREAGIASRDDLAAAGPVAALLRVRRTGRPASLNLLWAMAGALRGCHWTKVPRDEKQRLLAELESAGP